MVFVIVLFCCLAAALASNPEENLNMGRSGEDLFEGDMVLTAEQFMEIGGFTRGSANQRIWPKGIVPYVIESSISSESKAMSVIDEAFKAWESTTCIRFQKRTTETAYISIFKGSGCWSYVGRTGRKQQLSLASGCWYKGTVVHELGHALGFYHEQSRPDRDNYVTIMWENIKDGKEGNFRKHSTFDSQGTPYDYGSIMHYGKTYFTKNGKDTIVPKKAGATIGNRKNLSPHDITQMNRLYSCAEKPTEAPTLPPPTPSNCVDKHNLCAVYKKYGYCTKYKPALMYWCKKSCNFCG